MEKERIDKLMNIVANIRRKIHAIPTKQTVYKNVTFAQLKVIRFLGSKNKSTMTDIAKALSVKLPTASGLVEHLVNNGYLKRFNEPSDRRLVYAELSSKGYKMLDAISKRQRERLIKISDSMSNDKWMKFMKALETIDILLDETRQL
jgi:DNA-binding MarR family transcriptional regulator